MVDTPQVNFAVGSEVSRVSFYKSIYARSYAFCTRETRSLDFCFANSGTSAEEAMENNAIADNRNNNSLPLSIGVGLNPVPAEDLKLWSINEIPANNEAAVELEKLRKACQNLADENRRLQGTLAAERTTQSRVIENVVLQTQVDTLQWQLKQTEANRQMYHALMGQVVRFLERAHKSLDIMHEKSNPKGTNPSRGPRSRSVHAVDDGSPNHVSSQPSSSFSRAKSATQISPTSNNTKESGSFWSILRRPQTPPPRPEPQPVNQTHVGVVYRRRPKQSEKNPDEVPPERLSQEAFRLMRTVKSLLSTREPDLVRVSETEDSASPSPSDHEMALPPNFANSTALHDSPFSGSSSSDRGSFRTDHDTGYNNFRKPGNSSGECLLPRARRSFDATSLHSGSSKTTTSETTEEEDAAPRSLLVGVLERDFSNAQSSTPNRRTKPLTEPEIRFKPKPTASVSSAEDESGFSSMNSFQDVGLPAAPSPIKGCHTEVGLPEVPLSRVRHRRWSSTPAEMQGLFNARHNASFNKAKTPSDALKVLWV